MQFPPYLTHCFPYWAANYFTRFNFPGTPFNHLLPLGSRICINRFVEAGNQLPGQISPVSLWQCEHLGHSLSGNTHMPKISATTPLLASLMIKTQITLPPCPPR
jgi:hypothetical protein